VRDHPSSAREEEIIFVAKHLVLPGFDEACHERNLHFGYWSSMATPEPSFRISTP
jgi:hypothetical protein